MKIILVGLMLLLNNTTGFYLKFVLPGQELY